MDVCSVCFGVCRPIRHQSCGYGRFPRRSTRARFFYGRISHHQAPFRQHLSCALTLTTIDSWFDCHYVCPRRYQYFLVFVRLVSSLQYRAQKRKLGKAVRSKSLDTKRAADEAEVESSSKRLKVNTRPNVPAKHERVPKEPAVVDNEQSFRFLDLPGG